MNFHILELSTQGWTSRNRLTINAYLNAQSKSLVNSMNLKTEERKQKIKKLKIIGTLMEKGINKI